MALLGWRDALDYWYRIETWTAVDAFDYLVPIGGRDYAFIGGHDPLTDPLSAIATDSFQFKLMYGATRSANIGGRHVQTFPGSLAGELWSHTVDGADGVFRQATIRAVCAAPKLSP